MFAFPKRDGEWIGGWSGRIVSGGGAVVVVGHAGKQKEEEEGSVAVGCRQRGGGERSIGRVTHLIPLPSHSASEKPRGEVAASHPAQRRN